MLTFYEKLSTIKKIECKIKIAVKAILSGTKRRKEEKNFVFPQVHEFSACFDIVLYS